MSRRPVFSRRGAMLALGASALVRARPVQAASLGLRDLAAASRLQFGSASNVVIADAPAAYGAALAKDCGLLAVAAPWDRMMSQDETVDPARNDPNVAFAHQHGMQLTGGNLLSHKTLPPEFTAASSGPVAQAMAAAHVDRVVGRYAGRAFSWNVVDEAIDAEMPDGLRRSPLYNKLGAGFIASAFRTARAADPAAVLALNDAEFEMDTPRHAARRAALLSLLDGLARDHAPIDAVGLQTHMRLDGTRFDPVIYQRFLRDVAMRGLRILITEMDVSDVDVPGGIDRRDGEVAALYRDVLSVALAEPAVVGVVTSGFSDRYSWLTNPRSYRADGLPVRPLPLDDQFEAKPAYTAIEAALRARL